VVLAGRRLEPLEQVAEESGAGARAFAVPTDVSNAESVQSLFAATVERYGRVDLLFNNAGVGNPPGRSRTGRPRSGRAWSTST
jgi:NADP-dependent 3-hydroxy acid dehydrogenase YdfG